MSVDHAGLLRELHREGHLLLGNAWNAGSALRLQRLGFTAIGTTSAGIAGDAGLSDGEAGRDRTLEVCRDIVRSIEVPLSADLENGFDDSADGCFETVRLAAELGVAGGSIEDATGRADDPIYPFEHAVERIRAVAEAIRASSFDFMLTARSENFVQGRPDLDDTIRRLQAFEAAGADVLFAPGLPDMAAVRAVRGAVHKPVNVLLGSDREGLTVSQIHAEGIERVSMGPWIFRAANQGSDDYAREILASAGAH